MWQQQLSKSKLLIPENNNQKQCIPCVCTQMSHLIRHPTFAHNVYTCLQMSPDVYIHLPSRMTLHQLKERGCYKLSKQNDEDMRFAIILSQRCESCTEPKP